MTVSVIIKVNLLERRALVMDVREREALKAELKKLFEQLTYDEQKELIELIKSDRDEREDRE